MSDPSLLESRLARLEAKVAALEQQLVRDPSKANWLQKVVGTFENEPDFAEVLRLGRKFRASGRPAVRKSSRRRKNV